MIGAILLVLFAWGPQKIPELARAMGEARRELSTASRGQARREDNQPLES